MKQRSFRKNVVIKRGHLSRRSRKLYKRRNRPIIYTALSLLLLGIIASISAAYILTRPASVNIIANPSDSIIKLESLPPATGSLSATNLKPGTYQLEISRQGFKKHVERIKLIRGKIFKQRYSLKPLPYAFKLETNPEGANYLIKLADGSVRKGKTPFRGKLPAGKLKIELTLEGCNSLKRGFFLDHATTLTLWMDPKGQLLHCLNVFKCGPAPKGVAFTPDSKEAWVTLLGGPPSVQVYRLPGGKKLADINLGKHGAVEIIFSSDGSKAYASQMETARVYEIDTRTYRLLRTFDTKSAWSKMLELSPDGKTLFVSNWSGNDVSEIDLKSGKLRRRLPTVKTPRGLYATSDGKSLYVAGFGNGEIERINLVDGSRQVIFSGGGAVRHLAADEKRQLLYASDLSKDCVWIINLKTDKVRQLAKTDRTPNTIDLSPDGKVLYVSCRGADNPKSYYIPGPEWGSVIVIDTGTGKMLDAIVGGNQCTALDISPDGKFLIFSDFLDNRLRVYGTPSYEVLTSGGGGRAISHLKDLRK